MSPGTAKTSAPSFSSWRSARSSSGPGRALIATQAPSRASRLAIASPMPFEPPVITATALSKRRLGSAGPASLNM
jgi:hypothetical protein